MSGTAQSSALGAASFEAEDSFADSADDTITTRLEVRDDQIDVSGLQRPLEPRGGVYQRLAESSFDALGAYGVSTFTTTHYLEGHGAATTGSLTQTDLHKMLQHVFGNGNTASVGTTAAGTWSAVDDSGASGLTGGTFVDGGLLRVGALGDARGGGQWAAVNDYQVGTNEVSLLTALGGAPIASDVIYAPMMIYPVSSVASGGIITSSGATSNNTLRWILQTANGSWATRGCVATGASISVGVGTIPTLQVTWATVAWNPTTTTFPSATATSAKTAAAITAGSLYIQDKGTTTRNTDQVMDFSMEIDLGVFPVMGTEGENAGQNVVGWRRGPHKTTVSMSFEAEANGTNSWYDYFSTDPNSLTAKHILFSGSTVDGSAIGVYLKNCKPIGSVVSQTAVEGLNRVAVQFEAMTNSTTTDELIAANWVLGMA